MASLTAVRARMMIRGAALRPGFEAPKMENICDVSASATQAHLFAKGQSIPIG